MSLLFDSASSEWLQSATTVAHGIGTGDFSIVAWIKPATISGWQSYTANRIYQPAMYSCQSGGAWGMYFQGAGADQFQFDTTLSTGTWYCLIVTRSGTTLTGYVDGTAESTTHTVSKDVLTNAYMGVGTEDVNSGSGSFFNGNIEGVAWYDRVLTSGEISDISGGDPFDDWPTSGMVIGWKLDVPGDDTDNDYVDGDDGGDDVTGGGEHLELGTAPVWDKDDNPPFSSGGTTLTPGASTVTTSGVAPTLDITYDITASASSVSTSSPSTTVDLSNTLTVDADSIDLSGPSVTIDSQITKTPDPQAISVSAPSVSVGITKVSPNASVITLNIPETSTSLGMTNLTPDAAVISVSAPVHSAIPDGFVGPNPSTITIGIGEVSVSKILNPDVSVFTLDLVSSTNVYSPSFSRIYITTPKVVTVSRTLLPTPRAILVDFTSDTLANQTKVNFGQNPDPSQVTISAPSVVRDITLLPDSAIITLSGNNVTNSVGQTLLPDASVLSTSGIDLSLDLVYTLSPSFGEVTLSGQNISSIAQNLIIDPGPSTIDIDKNTAAVSVISTGLTTKNYTILSKDSNDFTIQSSI